LPGAPTETLQRGYRDAAAAVLSAAGERDPYHLVYAAGLAGARGEEAQAHQLWARARAGYDARGATLQVDAVHRRPTDLLLWHGKQLLRGEELSSKDRTGEGTQALRWLGTKRPQRRLMFARKAQRTMIGDDGTLLRSEGNAVIVHDVVSGIALRRIVADDGEIEDFVAAGGP